MAITPFKDAKIYAAQYDFSGDHNEIALDIGHIEKTVTVFGNAAERVKGALGYFNVSGGGYAQFGNGLVHAALRSQLNVADVPFTIAPVGAAGDYAEFGKAQVVTYTPGIKVGEFTTFKFAAKSQGDLSVAGRIMATGSKAGTTTSAAEQLGAVGATQSLFAALHVLAVTGITPTLDATVSSDDNSGFTSATTRATFAQKTALGSEYITPVQGPITDTWWRVGWAVGGSSSPSFSIVIVIGIANDARA